ncbi:MAG: trypsin-like peptidase domain-containing protein [Symploca sp. SIO2E9]|nr:trypsin-like peptidase domain-containing protein [Symploca sp. SIO2E9]
MSFSSRFPAVIVGAVLMLVNPPVTFARSASELAKSITVLIDGQNPGSGFIVSKQENIYYVLTAKHVVATEDEYEIVTPDGKRYLVDYSAVKKLPDVDLAVVPFISGKSYSVATLTGSTQFNLGGEVYVAGYPEPGREVRERKFFSTSGKIASLLDKSAIDGYALVYTNITRAGMSGGPVLDTSGHVIGVHGRAEAEQEGGLPNKAWVNLGVPINTFRELSSQLGLSLELQVYQPPRNVDEPLLIPDVPAVTPTLRRPTVIRNSISPDNPVCAGIQQNCPH